MEAGKQLNNLQILRAIAALMVFVVHLEDVERRYGGGALLGPWADAGAWGVDLFFVISVFVMVHITGHISGGASAAGRFLYARAARIYPLWWACLTALVAVWLFAPQMVYSGKHVDPPLLKDYLLIIHANPPLLETGWTLIHEMYFYAVFAVLLFAPVGYRSRFWLVLGWAALVIAGELALKPQAGTLSYLALHPMTLEFVMGAMAAYALRRWKGEAGLMAAIAGIAWLVLGVSAAILEPWRDAWTRVLMFGPGSALLVYGLTALETRNGARGQGLGVKIGDWSYSLYLTHMLTLNAFGVLWGMIALPSLADNAAGLIALTVACIACSWLSYRFFEMPVQRVLKGLGKRLFRERPAAIDQPSAALGR